MKKLISVLILCTLFILVQKSNAQNLDALPATKGIWLDMKTLFKAGNAIAISRQGDGGAQEDLATVEAARSFEVFKGRYRGSSSPVIANKDLGDTTLGIIWKHYSRAQAIDSIGQYRFDLNVLEALGAAWFDNSAIPGKIYTYNATIKTASGQQVKTSRNVKFPADNNNIAVIKPAHINPTMDGVYMEFEIEDKGTMHTCRVSRSYHMRSGYETITPLINFIRRDRKLYAAFTDFTAAPKVMYSYILTPVDIAGNEGAASEPAKLFNVPENNIPPSVRHLKATSDEKESAVRLTWSVLSTGDVVSVDIYRSKSYSGVYERIASVTPKDTVYFDYNVEPVSTNYYTVSLNGTFEQSVNSPRVPGTLKANRKNFIAPYQLEAKLKGNVVYLSWLKVERDTRGYRIYRGEGYKGATRLIHPLIATRDSFITFTDTLPDTKKATVFSYEVTDENTSYEESPHSVRVSVQYIPASAPAYMPVVTDVAIVPAEKGGLQILWTNLSQDDNGVEGYTVYKRAVDRAGKEVMPLTTLTPTPLPKRINFFLDADVKEGFTYYYSVKAGGKAGAGTASLESGHTIPLTYPLQVNNIQGYPHKADILLKWANPVGQPLNAIHILRATNGTVPQEIAKLDPTKDTYSDKSVAENTTYHYYFVTENSAGTRSAQTSAISVTTAE